MEGWREEGRKGGERERKRGRGGKSIACVQSSVASDRSQPTHDENA